MTKFVLYSFPRIGTALVMKVEDAYVQQRRLWVRLHKKDGKRHEMPCHHNLEAYLHAYTTEPASPPTRRGCCSVPSAAALASSPARRCCSPTSI